MPIVSLNDSRIEWNSIGNVAGYRHSEVVPVRYPIQHIITPQAILKAYALRPLEEYSLIASGESRTLRTIAKKTGKSREFLLDELQSGEMPLGAGMGFVILSDNPTGVSGYSLRVGIWGRGRDAGSLSLSNYFSGSPETIDADSLEILGYESVAWKNFLTSARKRAEKMKYLTDFCP